MPDPGDSTITHATAGARLAIDIVRDSGDWSALEPVETYADTVARALTGHPLFSNLGACEACIALSDDSSLRRLNASYRALDKPTNVLSFPASRQEPPHIGSVRVLGDVVVAEETLLREAQEQNIPAAHHFQHLLVHGLLHLLGFDHVSDADAEKMENLEVEILAQIGVANPYADRATEFAGPRGSP